MTIVVRDSFQAKYGKGDELVALFKDFDVRAGKLGFNVPHRLYTDASGQFFQVVTESEFPSMAEWETTFQKLLRDATFGPWFSKMVPLVETGRREFWNLVSQDGAPMVSNRRIARR